MSRQQRRQRRQNRRQANRTERQESRTQAKETRQKQRSRRQEARQASRSQRQQIRQENRTRRASGRQAVRMEKVVQKGESGFYTPEGVRARRQGTAEIIGASGQVVGDLAPLVAGALTGGASLGLTEGIGAIANNLGGLAGETGLQGFGGPVGLGGDPMQIDNPIEPMNQGFDFSFKNPIVLGGVALGGLGLYLMSRPKNKKSA